MITETLGYIDKCYFGTIDGRTGLWLTFYSEGTGVQTHWTFNSAERTSRTRWTEADRAEVAATVAIKVANLLREAKQTKVEDLAGTPVKLTWTDGHMLKDWRVLTEVLR